ncbi:hypothetical protein FQN60_006189 [Etheostoma spectabile]|uniref:Uncharacterized protein n=1 Tax=Etheostoma spectabile TaxID=54343 RepID=A0A5J5CKP8_9PERO|nr:hypothetical protein FQN60_006189 [Etheostoma spectabile]
MSMTGTLEKGPPPGIGPVRGTAAPHYHHHNNPPPASSQLQLPGQPPLWVETEKHLQCSRTSSLFCSESGGGAVMLLWSCGVPGLLGLLGAGDAQNRLLPDKSLPRWTGVRDHLDNGHCHGGIGSSASTVRPQAHPLLLRPAD